MSESAPSSPASPKASLRAKLILLGITLGFIFVVVEVGLRILGLGYAHSPLSPDPKLHHVRIPNFQFISHDKQNGEYGGHTVSYGSDGLIFDPEVGEVTKASGEVRLAILGDSFVECIEWPQGESFVGHLTDRAAPGVAVKNCGIASYSPVLTLVQWREIVSAFEPTHVLHFVYSNDVGDDEDYAAAGSLDEDGIIIASAGPNDRVIRRFFRRSFTARFVQKSLMVIRWKLAGGNSAARGKTSGFIPDNPELSDLTIRHILQIAEEVRATGATYTLGAIPSRNRLETYRWEVPPGPSFAERLNALAEEHELPFLDFTPEFEAAYTDEDPLFFINDIHFNQTGHRVAADAIAAIYPELFTE